MDCGVSADQDGSREIGALIAVTVSDLAPPAPCARVVS